MQLNGLEIIHDGPLDDRSGASVAANENYKTELQLENCTSKERIPEAKFKSCNETPASFSVWCQMLTRTNSTRKKIKNILDQDDETTEVSSTTSQSIDERLQAEHQSDPLTSDNQISSSIASGRLQPSAVQRVLSEAEFNLSNYGNDNGRVPTPTPPPQERSRHNHLKKDLNCAAGNRVETKPPPPFCNAAGDYRWLDQCQTKRGFEKDDSGRARPRLRSSNRGSLAFAAVILAASMLIAITSHSGGHHAVRAQTLQSDPRPTIYSGQVSFGLLLSAHSSPGSELSTAASSLHDQREMLVSGNTALGIGESTSSTESDTIALKTTPQEILATAAGANKTLAEDSPSDLVADASAMAKKELEDEDEDEQDAGQVTGENSGRQGRRPRVHTRRQIFERPNNHQRRQQQQLQKQQQAATSSTAARQQDSSCSQVNPSALYAGMGAIWASHQANLVGDSQLAIGTYVYDSCNDLDVGQRQSVRIVSNLNAFQQTTCESPRGSPISLTIAHGENQLRAIQLLTSFRVPVITTKEPFALEDYHLLSKEQRRFLFSTAPSSRHLAVGALKFARRVVSRSTSSPKLPNQFHKMSSKNGLIVISRNLPAKFITYLTETIPNHVNYEMLQTNQPIDQVRSVEALESILMLNSGKSPPSSASSTSSQSGGSGSESRISQVRVQAFSSKLDKNQRRRTRRSDSSTSSDSDANSSNSDQDDASEAQQQRMLSPTILMFITPSEAIDLVTRLRNDLAEVSKYYSLVVATREDISPALRTIFHRGGSRLCSGKAFYTISPKPDEVHEFSRYFRDTVQMEGESSDHPLICEFAKHQSTSKTNADLDDIATESVIKAVWAAAAAFKSVHQRECGLNGSGGGPTGGGNLYSSTSNPAANVELRSQKQGRRQSSSGNANQQQQQATNQKSECMVKMNKNMSNLVQRALRKLDVQINSTGLQALDGFRIKFDESNELLTNKFSIKYINKECEITELGQYSGWKDSQLRLDDDVLMKSLESTLPDPWPLSASSPSTSVGNPTITTSSQSTAADSPSSSPAFSPDDSTPENSSTSSSPSSSDETPPRSQTSADEEQEPSTSLDNDKLPSIVIENENENDSPKRRRSNQRVKLSKRKIQVEAATRQPISMSSGRGFMPGLTDFAGQADTTQRPTAPPTTTSRPTLVASNVPVGNSAAPSKPMRKMKPFPAGGQGTTLKDWIPKEDDTVTTTTSTTKTPRTTTEPWPMSEQMKTTSTTQTPIYATNLPESGGNTDLEMPTFKSSATTTTTTGPKRQNSLETAASAPSEASSSPGDYVTLPSIVRQLDASDRHVAESQATSTSNQLNATHRSYAATGGSGEFVAEQPHLSYLRDLNSSPVPISSLDGPRLMSMQSEDGKNAAYLDQSTRGEQKSSRSKLRSHLKWIYGSWFTLAILGANICGALLTLYVLTFLLMKNCDGSLDRENQGIRSMHLLSIIVVFFGSTLFIVYPTPSLCLLRTSWHNFALVLMFGSLLLQTMQTRSINSIGLGGRPNKLNQFLTLLFMVGVQVSFELQRWKYESANYISFVNQYFSSPENGDKKLALFNSAFAGQFNPFNSFNDQVTPVSIQVSEKYQSLLHDYCTQPIEDFLQSQIYLWLIISLLIVFSITTRREQTSVAHHGALLTSHTTSIKTKSKKTPAEKSQKSKSSLTTTTTSGYNQTSGKLLASQHETNDLPDLSPGHQTFGGAGPFSVGSKVAHRHTGLGNVFMVTLVSAPIYFVSIVLHVHGQSLLGASNHDLVTSITMVLVAFTVLLGIFMPVLRSYHRYGELVAGGSGVNSPSSLVGSLSRPIMAAAVQNRHQANKNLSSFQGGANSPAGAGAFAMFPEFASTGLRRPSSIGGESTGAAGRYPFAETKESRRNMGLSLANLPAGPADTLRSLCIHNHRSQPQSHHQRMSAGYNNGQHQQASPMVKMQQTLPDEDELMLVGHDHLYKQPNGKHHHHRVSQQPQQPTYAASRRLSMSSQGEKRLIMLDVDPCCPRHGVAGSTTPVDWISAVQQQQQQQQQNHSHHNHHHHRHSDSHPGQQRTMCTK